MKINKDIVLDMEKRLNCPILEMFFTDCDGYWYVCFEQYITINGIDQIVTLDDVMEEIKKYDNVEYFTNETYIDDDGNWFEQVTFQWQ